MANEKEKVVSKFRPEQLESMRRWSNALESRNEALIIELLNQVLDGKITNEAALALLDSQCD